MKYIYILGAVIVCIAVFIFIFTPNEQTQTIDRQITDILLVPVGDYNIETLTTLQNNLQQTFPKVVVSVSDKTINIPPELFEHERAQYDAVEVINHIHLALPNRSSNQVVVAIMNNDIYSGWLNFVFSSSHQTKKVGVVSTYNLGSEIPTFSESGLEIENHNYVTSVINDRVYKTTLRMVGGIIGLNTNVRNRSECAMNFSNTLAELDSKGTEWCNDDEEQLKAAGLL